MINAPRETPDINSLIGAVAARNRIRLDDDDPIFAVTTINRLMLDDALEGLISRIQDVLKDFKYTSRDVENQAGKFLAQEVRNAAKEWRDELAKDIRSASLRSAELVREVHLAHSKPSVIRWASLGLFAGLLFLGCGILLGIYVR